MLSVTYVSAACSWWSEQQLTDLLTSSRSKNGALGLTGVLLYQGGNFMQTLEGPGEFVSSVFGDIKADVRHGGVSIVLWDQIDEREFPGWSMGFRSLQNGEADSLLDRPGYLAALRSGPHVGQQPSRAAAFHRVFREGA